MQNVDVKGMAHITGGGLLENIHRMFPASLAARVEQARWPRPAIFDWLQRAGNVAEAEMHRVFNCGIGMVVVVAAADAERASALAHRGGRDRIPDRRRRPARGGRARHCRRVAGASGHRHGDPPRHRPRFRPRLESARAPRRRARGPRSAERSPPSSATARRSPRSTSRQRMASPASSSPHEAYAERDAFDAALAAAIDATEPDLVVLAGFMRILGPELVARYEGRMLNIHPSLLPSYPGLAHASPRAGGRRAHPRLHRALRDRGARPRADRRAGRGSRARRRRRSVARRARARGRASAAAGCGARVLRGPAGHRGRPGPR